MPAQIDLLVWDKDFKKYIYFCSTTRAHTLKEAIKTFCFNYYINPLEVKAEFHISKTKKEYRK